MLQAPKSTPSAKARALVADGHSVFCISDPSAGIDDDTVLTKSFENRAVLITADKDFGRLVFFDRRAAVGVLLIRLPGLSLDLKVERVRQVVADYGPRLIGAFSVLQADRVRIRTGPSNL